jgi:TPR repeat protein
MRLPSADLRSWTMHDHDQAAHWYRKAAEQGGKTGLKRLGYWFLLIGIATITGTRRRRLKIRLAAASCSQRHSYPDAGAIAQWRRTDDLAKVAPIQAWYYTPVSLL